MRALIGSIVFLALAQGAGSAQPAEPAADFVVFRFGMTEAEALAVDPSLSREAAVGGDLTLMTGAMQSYFGLQLRPRLSFRDGALTRVGFSVGGLLGQPEMCVSHFETVLDRFAAATGALTDPSGPGEYGAPQREARTASGARVRYYASSDGISQFGFANAFAPRWVQAAMEFFPSATGANAPTVCEISIEMRAEASASPPALAPPTAEALAAARLLEHPLWDARPSSDAFEMTLPPRPPLESVEVDVELDCLVLETYALNCVPPEQSAVAGIYGEMALRLSRRYRIAAELDGESTIGRRVRAPIRVSLVGLDASPPSAPASGGNADLEALRQLLERAPSESELASAAIIERPRWEERPSANDFERYFPPEALDREIDGRVVLDCLVEADRRLRCGIAEEEPAGHDFGLAAIGIAQAFRIALEIDGAPTPGKRVRVPISFRIG